jgi:hypothetical protein
MKLLKHQVNALGAIGREKLIKINLEPKFKVLSLF